MQLAVASSPVAVIEPAADTPLRNPTREVRLSKAGMFRVREKTFTDENGMKFTLLRVKPKYSQEGFKRFCSRWIREHLGGPDPSIPLSSLGVISVSGIAQYHYLKFRFHPFNADGSLAQEGWPMESHGLLGLVVEIKELANQV